MNELLMESKYCQKERDVHLVTATALPGRLTGTNFNPLPRALIR